MNYDDWKIGYEDAMESIYVEELEQEIKELNKKSQDDQIFFDAFQDLYWGTEVYKKVLERYEEFKEKAKK